jgi:hypothetical protein
MAKKIDDGNLNIIPLETVNQVKILSMYDFIKENREKIENDNYKITALTRVFGLKKVEIATYLKPVCDLSQKLGTNEVCDTLFSIKEKMMEDEEKKKKPTLVEVEFSHYLKDDRLKLFTSNESTQEKLEDKQDKVSVYPIEENISKTPSMESKKDEDYSSLLSDADDSRDVYIPNGINDEDIILDIEKELKTETLEVKEESHELNFSTDNANQTKKSNTLKKILIGFGATSLIVGSLYGTYEVLLNGKDSDLQQEVSFQSPLINNQNVLSSSEIKNDASSNPPVRIEMPQPSKVEMPAVVKNEDKISMPSFDNTASINVPNAVPLEDSKPTLNIEQNNISSKKVDELEKALFVIMNKLDALEQSKTSSVPNTSSSETIVQPVKLEEKIELKDVKEFEKEFKKFKFEGKTLEYKGQLFNEGDSIGNIKIEYIIPDVHIRVWDTKEGYPFVKIIK